MKKYSTSLLLMAFTFLGVSLTPSLVSAQEWKGQGEVGLVKSSGNTDSENFNVGLEFSKKTEVWRHEIGAKYFKSSSNGIDSADSFSADYIAKRALNERSFLFAELGYLDDSFDGFTEQSSASIGYGYKVFDTEPMAWEVGVGVGYRDTNQLIKLDDGSELEGKDVSGATFVLHSAYRNQITANTAFIDKFKAEIGSDNSFFENEAALMVSMSEKFALKAGLLIRHNTDPAPGADDTDTLSSMNLIYHF